MATEPNGVAVEQSTEPNGNTVELILDKFLCSAPKFSGMTEVSVRKEKNIEG